MIKSFLRIWIDCNFASINCRNRLFMNKIFIALSLLIVFASCTSHYKIKGESSVSSLDGKMLYVKSFKNGQLQNIDSAEVVHGFFEMKGEVDTAEMVLLFMDDNVIMPFVLEEGSVKIRIEDARLSARGTKFNDELYDFFDEKNKIDSRVDELERMETRMILDGVDPVSAQQKLMDEGAAISDDMSRLIKGFLKKNSENILGSGVFLLLCQSAPIMTPEIEEILSELPASFCDNPQVKEYVDSARENLKMLREHSQMSTAH